MLSIPTTLIRDLMVVDRSKHVNPAVRCQRRRSSMTTTMTTRMTTTVPRPMYI
jgi:hypothetical protein